MPTPRNEEMESSEQESWQLIDGIPGPIAILTKTGDVDMVNHHLLEYFGTTLEKSRHWGPNDLVHSEDLPPLIELFTRSIESGTPFESEQRLRRWDGAYRWFRTRIRPEHDKNGQVVRWCVLLTDIDDWKRAEDALRTSERNLQLIIDALPALTWSARADGFAEFFNRHYLDYTGLSENQLRGWSWTAAIHPDDLAGLAATWQRIMDSEEAGEAEARIRRFNGAYRWFLFRANPLRDKSGKIIKWYGTNLDIEDRKRGEEALRASELSWRQIVDNIPGLVATMGAMGEVEFLNRQTLEYFGKTNEELKNWALIDAVHPDDLPGVIETRIKSIETGQPYDVEHRCRRADGVYRWFQVRGLPVRNAEGTITTWYLLLTDIDDRKKAEEARQSSERNLSQMINAIPCWSSVFSSDGSVLYRNQAVSDYTGFTLEDARKEDFRARVFHPDDVERVREERRQAFTHPVPFENEQRVLGKDGKYRWFLFRYKPLLDKQGRIHRWYTAALDIDDRKQAEAQVEQAYLRLAEAQQLSKTGSFITDLVADDHNWSEETFRIFEFDPGTKVTVQMIREIVHPEDLASFDDMIARALTGTDVDFVFRIITFRGAVKHVRGMARILTQTEGRPLFIGALQDVTDNKIA
jgi:PAS domain S-box-containing protein